MPTLIPRPASVTAGDGSFSLTGAVRIAYAGLFSEGSMAAAALLRDRLGADYALDCRVVCGAEAGASSVLIGLLDDEGIVEALGGDAPATLKPEGYALKVSPGRVVIAGADPAGAFYGVQSLLQLIDASGDTPSVACGLIKDFPEHPFRGVHMYVPPKREIPNVLRLIEYLAACKINTVVMEMAAAVELKRHPEMNRAWEEYAEVARRFPGRQGHLQNRNTLHSRGKDSNHFEQGGGTCLSQDDLRRILRHARKHHVRIVPEIQSPCHAYWMCLAHPEVAEWQGDTYPDTFCPSNPKSYALLFDVMDELIELMEPEWVHTGNDEMYFYAICPKCRGRDGGDILAGHVNKVNEFLRARGIKHVMWGDKLINPDETDSPQRPEHGTGRMIKWGGGERVLDDAAGEYVQRATYGAVDKIPDDILVWDWYWSLAGDTERYFARHGKQVVWGNFNPLAFCDHPDRLYASNVNGAELSTWIKNARLSLAHHNWPFLVSLTADVLWRRMDAETEPRKRMAEFADFQRRNRDTLDAPDLKRPTRANEPVEFETLALPEAGKRRAIDLDMHTLAEAAKAYGLPLAIADPPLAVTPDGRGAFTISVEKEVRSVVLLCGLDLSSDDLNLPPLWDYGDYGEYFRSVEAGALEATGEFAVKNPRHPGHAFRSPLRLGMELGSVVEPYGLHWISRPAFCDALLLSDGRAVFAYEWRNPIHPGVLVHDLTVTRGRGDVPGDLLVFAATAVL